MVFLADVFVPCETCGGTRFKREVLDVKIHGQSIHDVLQWTVDEAITRFRHQPKLGAALWHLQQVGLGYLRLGQPATTLSGGEAQRLKIARELAQAGKKAGPEALHPRRADHRAAPRRRAGADQRARPAGGRGAHGAGHRAPPGRDQAGRLGDRPGARGGERWRRVVAQGTPEAVAAVEGSHTGRYLREVLNEPRLPGALARLTPLQRSRRPSSPPAQPLAFALARGQPSIGRQLFRACADERPGLLDVPQFRRAGTDRHADGVAAIERRV